MELSTPPTPAQLKELRERYERDELQGEELVQALVLLMGYDRQTAELIVSGDFLPGRDGEMERIA